MKNLILSIVGLLSLTGCANQVANSITPLADYVEKEPHLTSEYLSTFSEPYIVRTRIIIETNTEGVPVVSTAEVERQFNFAIDALNTIHVVFQIEEFIYEPVEPDWETYVRMDDWCESHCLNVYFLYNKPKYEKYAGLSTFPWSIDSDLHGVWIFGKYNGSSVLVHELGHMLGLPHASITNDDFCDDTNPDNFEYNIMTNQYCVIDPIFTIDQLHRMRSFLLTSKRRWIIRNENH